MCVRLIPVHGPDLSEPRLIGDLLTKTADRAFRYTGSHSSARFHGKQAISYLNNGVFQTFGKI